jgi:hypothetical protein
MLNKTYRFTQQLLNYQENYFEMEGYLEDILERWCKGPWQQTQGEYYGYSIDCHESLYYQVTGQLEKQKVFIEIVDDSCYSCGWITKIEEIQDEVRSN